MSLLHRCSQTTAVAAGVCQTLTVPRLLALLAFAQEKLQTLGFTCACPVCRGAGSDKTLVPCQSPEISHSPDPASDRRRERLWQLSEEIPSCEDPEQAAIRERSSQVVL